MKPFLERQCRRGCRIATELTRRSACVTTSRRRRQGRQPRHRFTERTKAAGNRVQLHRATKIRRLGFEIRTPVWLKLVKRKSLSAFPLQRKIKAAPLSAIHSNFGISSRPKYGFRNTERPECL